MIRQESFGSFILFDGLKIPANDHGTPKWTYHVFTILMIKDPEKGVHTYGDGWRGEYRARIPEEQQ